MADFTKKDYTTVNFTVVDDVTAEWEGTVTEFSGAYQKATPDPTFVKLEELGFSGGFPGKFDAAMEGLITNVNAVIAEVKSYIEQLKNEDNTLAGLFPEAPGNDDQGTKPPPSGGGGDSGKDNSAEQVAYFKTMSLSDLKEVVAILTKYAEEHGMTLDQLLADVKNGDAIRELLLKSPNLSAEYKALLEAGTSEATLKALASLLNGDIPEAVGISKTTSLTGKTYLTNVAKANNLTYNELVTDDKNDKLFRKALKDMSSVLDTIATFNESNIQAKIIEIINGTYKDTQLTDAGVTLIKSHIASVMETASVSLEDLLTKSSYQKDLYNSMEDLSRMCVFSGALSSYKDASDVIAKQFG